MLISPSIASGDPLRLADEITYCDNYFDAIHLDVADGVAVRGISFGLRTCIEACRLSRAGSKSIHLEVNNPLIFIEDLKRCDTDRIFIQTDNLANPIDIIRAFQSAGLSVGVNVSDADLGQSYLEVLLGLVDPVLVGTTSHDDPAQVCRVDMIEFATELAEDGLHEVWIDGGITPEILNQVRDSHIYAAVLGRAIFEDRNRAIKLFSEEPCSSR